MKIWLAVGSRLNAQAENDQVHNRRNQSSGCDLKKVTPELYPFFPKYCYYAHTCLPIFLYLISALLYPARNVSSFLL